MRQVPHYLLIGGGRVARHFRHFFLLRQLSCATWQRSDPLEKLHQLIPQATHILLLISDNAIHEFDIQNLKNASAVCIHFSGSIVSEHIYGAHPLMTFADTLYDVDTYLSVPFIIDQDAPPFEQLLPGLPNMHVRLDKALKAKYHALCVLSGNFSCLLWQKLLTTFEDEFHFPAAIAHPYLLQQAQNIAQDYQSALTGPLIRRDEATIEKNLAALIDDPFQDVYKSIVACYQAEQKRS